MPGLPLLLDEQIDVREPVLKYVLSELAVCELTGAGLSWLKRSSIKIAHGGILLFSRPAAADEGTFELAAAAPVRGIGRPICARCRAQK